VVYQIGYFSVVGDGEKKELDQMGKVIDRPI